MIILLILKEWFPNVLFPQVEEESQKSHHNLNVYQSKQTFGPC